MKLEHPILIDILEAYNYAKQRGYEPLIDNRFVLPISLRLELQNNLFGKQSPENDIKYYNWVWENKIHTCEESGTPLHNYSACFVSHILTKGAFTEMRYDGRNNNLISLHFHNIWDRETEENKKKLKIYWKNQKTINTLKNEYNC